MRLFRRRAPKFAREMSKKERGLLLILYNFRQGIPEVDAKRIWKQMDFDSMSDEDIDELRVKVTKGEFSFLRYLQ